MKLWSSGIQYSGAVCRFRTVQQHAHQLEVSTCLRPLHLHIGADRTSGSCELWWQISKALTWREIHSCRFPKLLTHHLWWQRLCLTSLLNLQIGRCVKQWLIIHCNAINWTIITRSHLPLVPVALRTKSSRKSINLCWIVVHIQPVRSRRKYNLSDGLINEGIFLQLCPVREPRDPLEATYR